MGNCLFVNQKPIRIMKTDGKILEYKSPIRVFQVLSHFSGGHVISDAVPVTQNLQAAAKLLSGRLYYLVPKAGPEKKAKEKKTVRFAEVEKEIDGRGGPVVRIKVVMRKKQLEEMVERGGIAAEELILKNGEIISCREIDEYDEQLQNCS